MEGENIYDVYWEGPFEWDERDKKIGDSYPHLMAGGSRNIFDARRICRAHTATIALSAELVEMWQKALALFQSYESNLLNSCPNRA